jgi:type IV pilus assembly protein PilA
MLKIQRNSKGFTLIELLIVIAIIGILAAIAIPAYTGYTKKSKVGGVVHAMGGLKTAAAAYYTEKGYVNMLNCAAIGDIPANLGVTVPTQYISDASVVGNALEQVTIQVTMTRIGSGVDGKYINLTSTGTGLQTWTWNGDADSTYIPKN